MEEALEKRNGNEDDDLAGLRKRRLRQIRTSQKRFRRERRMRFDEFQTGVKTRRRFL